MFALFWLTFLTIYFSTALFSAVLFNFQLVSYKWHIIRFVTQSKCFCLLIGNLSVLHLLWHLLWLPLILFFVFNLLLWLSFICAWVYLILYDYFFSPPLWDCWVVIFFFCQEGRFIFFYSSSLKIICSILFFYSGLSLHFK